MPGRIPWRDLRDWSAAHAHDAERTAFLDAAILAMDGVYLAWWRAQLPTKGG